MTMTKSEYILKTVLSKRDAERFWTKVVKSSGVYGDSGRYKTECWCWTAGKESGYGRIMIQRKLILAHRLSWEMHFDKIPKDQCVLHKCDNRGCINPHHLFLGTRKDNNIDRQTKGRSSGGRNGGGHKGEKNGRAKLTESDIIDIRSRPSSQTAAFIAKEYGVKKETIYAIRNGRLWPHIA